MIELVISQEEWPAEQQADGMVAEWKAAVGDTVKLGETILEIVVVKTNMEVPAPVSGILLEICVAKGELFKPETVLARIG